MKMKMKMKYLEIQPPILTGFHVCNVDSKQDRKVSWKCTIVRTNPKNIGETLSVIKFVIMKQQTRKTLICIINVKSVRKISKARITWSSLISLNSTEQLTTS